MPIVLALAEPPPAAVAPAPPRPSVITMPDWLSKPTAADMSRFYPPAAAADHIEGRAILHCKVAASGLLTDCAAGGEDPPGQGFAEAALALAPMFKMRPMTKDGAPVDGGKINIPIRFGLPKPPPPLTLESALECYGVTSVTKVKLTNGEDAEIGWREAVQTLAGREHLAAAEVEAELAAAKELAGTPAGAEGARAQLARCSAIRSTGAVRPLRAAPPLGGG